MSKKDEALKLALKKAFDLGKRYWQQANSDFTSQWRKSDVTLASFNQLVEDTIRDALAEQPAQQQEPVAGWDSIEAMASRRYKVVPSHDSMFYRHAVVAGNGTQQLYIGREVECENMARKFAGAFLDGAFVMQSHTSPPNVPMARANKPWVGLTDVEIDALAMDEDGLPNSHIELARAIEAKLKEKNT